MSDAIRKTDEVDTEIVNTDNNSGTVLEQSADCEDCEVTEIEENSDQALEIEQQKKYSMEMLAVEYLDILGADLDEELLDEEDDFLDSVF